MMKNRVLLFSLLVPLPVALAAGFFLYSFSRADGAIREEFALNIRRTAVSEMRPVYEAYYRELGAAGMLDELEDVFPLCHSEGHALGRVIYNDTRDLNGAIEACGARCAGGCFHGVLMEAFTGAGPVFTSATGDAEGHVSLEEAEEKARELCEDPEVLRFHRKPKCTHGMGHALMHLAGYDIAQALGACKAYNDRRLELYCAGGVFMEYESVYGERDIAEKSLHYPCDTYAEFPSACYTHKARYLRPALKNIPGFAKECLALNGFSRLGCFRGLGFAYVGDVLGSPEKIREVCGFGSPDDKRMCIEGVMEAFVQGEADNAWRVCAYVGEALKPWCQDIIERGSFSLEKSFDLHFK